MLLLECPDAILRQRLHTRAEIEGQHDNNIEIICKRLSAFHSENTSQLIRQYFDAHKLVAIDASKSQDEVLANIEHGLSKYINLVPKQRLSPTFSEPDLESSDSDWESEYVHVHRW